MTADLDSTSLTERIVLLGVVERIAADGGPVSSVEARNCCLDHLDDVETDVLGSPSEADVMRTLRALAAEDYLAEREPEDPSPTGKGRPAYDLEVAPAAVVDAVESDDRLAPIVDRVSDRLAGE